MSADAELAWIAGLIEGEGAIRICRKRRRLPDGSTKMDCGLTVVVAMVDEECIDFLHRRFGGWKGTQRKATEDRQHSYMWNVTSAHAGRVLSELQPFFRSSRVREKCRLALEFQEQKRPGAARHIPGYTEKQTEYYEAMKILNLRGKEAIAHAANKGA